MAVRSYFSYDSITALLLDHGFQFDPNYDGFVRYQAWGNPLRIPATELLSPSGMSVRSFVARAIDAGWLPTQEGA